jgi:hypothetical protein
VFGQEVGQVFLPGLHKHSEVAPVNDLNAKGSSTTDELAEVRVELRRATGDIEGADAGAAGEKM